MSSSSVVVCREIFDENSQPSAEEISEYAQQLGIDPESESHLLPLAKDGLMQALPPPWKAYFDEKLQTHYYYNEETKKTQWEHPLDNVYRELVKKARDASMHDDTCASVQELLTSEEITNKNLERVETKVESDDDDLTTDSDNHTPEVKDNIHGPRRLTPLGRPPLGPTNRLERKLADLKINSLKRADTDPFKPLVRNISDRDILRQVERPKVLFKQQSEIIDLKMHVLTSPEEESFGPFLLGSKIERGFSLQGKGAQFLRVSKSDLPSPDTDKSLPLDSMTKSDPPKGILRDKLTDSLSRKTEGLLLGRPRHSASLDEDRKSVRFKLENPDPTISPGSNSSSSQNDQNSIASAPPGALPLPSPLIPSSPINLASPVDSPVPFNPNTIVLSPLVTRPPLPPRPGDSPREVKTVSGSDRESLESDRGTSPRRRVVRPPAAEFIKPDLFQKSFHKISDLVRPTDIDPTPVLLDLPVDREARPRSPMIPQQKNKISINLMESIESETSIDSPDKEFANLDLNDLDISNDVVEKKESSDKESSKVEDNSEKTTNSKTSLSTQNKSPILIENIPQIKVPKLDLSPNLSPKQKSVHSDSDESKKAEELKASKSESVEVKPPLVKVSPTPSFGSDLRSPRYEFNKPWSSPLSTFKPLNKAVIAPLKSSDSASSLGKNLTSPRLDGVILSQGKSTDNVVVVYQFENISQEDSLSKPIRSPIIPDMAARDMMERNKGDERRRLELALQKELESIRVEWCAKERRLRAELQEELKEAEEKFLAEKKVRLAEQAERHKREMEEAIESSEKAHEQALETLRAEAAARARREEEAAERRHAEDTRRLHSRHQGALADAGRQLEREHERALQELSKEFQAALDRERTRLAEENRATIQSLREEHAARVADLRTDYRAEVERLRTQHACHLQELRARSRAGATAGATSSPAERALHDKYKCLKEKYARLKHDVKMSIERRNKRREMSMTTGSETEKSNSHKQTQSLERCKELNETSVSAVIESEPRTHNNNSNSNNKYKDNETSHSESNAHRSSDNNNSNTDWKLRRENTVPATAMSPQVSKRPHRRTAVAFREPPRSRDRDRDRDRDKDGAVTTDYQDSSDATTSERVKEPSAGCGRRRCFTRLKSASTSRLNYSPKRGEGWSSPLESLRQQLRKLDDLEDQFPDLACQPAYSLRYPFAELGGVSRADTPELEFVRHRALVEREGMRRARAALKRRRAALRDTAAAAQRAPSEEREATELEVALHRARALLGEKEIRLRHIERALRRLAAAPTHHIQEGLTSDGSSGSEGSAGERRREGGGAGVGEAGEAEGEEVASGAVLRSLRALHADVRDIWRALELRPSTASPETSSANAGTSSHTRMTLSAPEPIVQDHSDGGVAERARGLRAWLQTAP